MTWLIFLYFKDLFILRRLLGLECAMWKPFDMIVYQIFCMYARHDCYTFEKRYYVFHLTTRFVCLSVCLSVCVSVCLCVCVYHQDCAEMARLSNTVLSEAITLDNSSTLQHYQDNPFPFPFHMGHPYKITFLRITSKVIYGFTPNLTCM